jgi:hypothetical protein
MIVEHRPKCGCIGILAQFSDLLTGNEDREKSVQLLAARGIGRDGFPIINRTKGNGSPFVGLVWRTTAPT